MHRFARTRKTNCNKGKRHPNDMIILQSRKVENLTHDPLSDRALNLNSKILFLKTKYDLTFVSILRISWYE